MTDNVKNGLLVVIAVLTLINTVILATSDSGVSYEKTSLDNTSNISNAAANQVSPATPMDNNDAYIPEVPAGPATSIAFEKMEHDFGTIEQNTTNPYVFEFTNTGTEPLIITDAKGSCGCTVPEYPRQPLQPGETGEIKVVYSPGQQKKSTD